MTGWKCEFCGKRLSSAPQGRLHVNDEHSDEFEYDSGDGELPARFLTKVTDEA